MSARLETRGDGRRVVVVETRNTGRVGHAFAEGPTDLTQTWLAARVADGSGRVLVESGGAGPEGAVHLGTRLFDAAGAPITDHRLWAVERVEERGRIPAREARIDEVELPADPGGGPLAVSLAWRYRRLDPALVRELTGTEPVGLPIVTIASLDTTL